MFSSPASGGDMRAPGTQSKSFDSKVGNWHIDKDGSTIVYAVDGRNGGPAFPLSVFKGVKDFKNGTVEVSFKPVNGKEDQAAGIVFNLKPNGDYLVVRANALEDNLILFKMEKGHRSALKEIGNVPTASGEWHSMKIVIDGKNIEGYIDGKKYLVYTYKENVNGEIGLWSKADSYVFFNNFVVKPAQ